MLQRQHNLSSHPQPAPAQSFAEFVALMALLIALTALSIDIMLPALPQISANLQFPNENDRQYVIISYVAGFAAGQIVFGPLADRFGRKSPLLAGLLLYCVGSGFAVFANDMSALFLARVIQGLGAAGPRVIAIAIVRDRFEGREMARVMSIVMTVFMIIPFLAPSAGQAVAEAASWRTIFVLMLGVGTAALIWAAGRLPETSGAEARVPFSLPAIGAAALTGLMTVRVMGYIVAQGFVFGIMMAYVTTAEQIFVGIYGLGKWFPVIFSLLALFLVAASLVNAAIVRRAGMRVVSYAAAAGLLAVCLAAGVSGFPQQPPLIAFLAFMAAAFFCFGLMMPNFTALAMESNSQIAGTISSMSGFYSTAAGIGFATLIGQSFDGTVRPFVIGITALVASAGMTLVLLETLGRRFEHDPQ